MRVKGGGAVSHSGWERWAGLTRFDWQLSSGTSKIVAPGRSKAASKIQSLVVNHSPSTNRKAKRGTLYHSRCIQRGTKERLDKKKVKSGRGKNKRLKRSEVRGELVNYRSFRTVQRDQDKSFPVPSNRAQDCWRERKGTNASRKVHNSRTALLKPFRFKSGLLLFTYVIQTPEFAVRKLYIKSVKKREPQTFFRSAVFPEEKFAPSIPDFLSTRSYGVNGHDLLCFYFA